MDPARQKRRKEINRALEFIQSPLAFPEPVGYQDFLTKLVCNLLDEGNALFRDRDWEQAVREFSEGLSVSSYATAQDLHIPEVLLESLYVNRAATYHSMGDYERGAEDCDRALKVCKESRKALYRKALCLKELGKYREAYDCTTDCLLISRLDKQVNDLAQELAVHLRLKYRKPYVSAKEHTLITRDTANVNTTAEAFKVPSAHIGNGVNPLSVLAPVSFPSMPQATILSTTPVSFTVTDLVDTVEDSELMGDDLDNLLDCFPNDEEPSETHTRATGTRVVPAVLPPPTPQLPPAFFSSNVSQLNSLDIFSGCSSTSTTLDVLDDLSSSDISGGADASSLGQSVVLDALDGLDSLDDFTDTTPIAAKNESKSKLEAGGKSLDDLLDRLHPLEYAADPSDLSGEAPTAVVKRMDQLDSIDVLDSFPSVEGRMAPLKAGSIGGTGLHSLSNFSSTGTTGSHTAVAPVTRSPKNNSKERRSKERVAGANPLSSTHEFLQACSACFPRKGQGIHTFVHKPDLVHNCKRDILLCKRKVGHPSEWTRVRPIPQVTSFSGPFVLCRELLNSGDLGLCKFGENCTFAYNQLEIDVWTEERTGRLDRNLLFEKAAVKLDPVNSVIRLLQEHKGAFVFLCQECYDSKPRIISIRSKESHTVCSNVDARHTFDANKCLAFMVKSHSVNYSKVRPLSVLCQLDSCCKASRYGCHREDNCIHAHSLIELKTWRVQRDTGIGPDEIVKVSTTYYEKQEQSSSKPKGNRPSPSGGGVSKPRVGGGGVGGGKTLNMKMKFACAQCWQRGLISEPDKALKYCTAKARHPWTKDRLLLVKSLERSKWVEVRPLPHAKTFPLYYYMCDQISNGKKCNYTGKCTFAHSQEEKEMWMYMKNNDLWDMQKMYDMWLPQNTNNRQADGATATQPVPEEKYIAMPTDFAELMSGFHCRLCGRHSNSERQWQQHISSEKHKDRVFSCEGEDEALTWNYRFPGTCFQLCPKLDDGCSDGVSCDFAHCPEELQEWTERRVFLRQKLAKAREDNLIMPDEVDFGKYNFLLQD